MRFSADMLNDLPVWNPAAIIAYLAGAIAAIMNAQNIVFDPETTVPALLGLGVSILTYLIAVFAGLGRKRAGN